MMEILGWIILAVGSIAAPVMCLILDKSST